MAETEVSMKRSLTLTGVTVKAIAFDRPRGGGDPRRGMTAGLGAGRR
jgi:hypothetical protein